MGHSLTYDIWYVIGFVGCWFLLGLIIWCIIDR